MAKVFWTEREKAKVVEAAIRLSRDDPKLRGLALLRAATATLPAARQRHFVTLKQAPWFVDRISRRLPVEQLDAMIAQLETIVKFLKNFTSQL